MIVRRHFQNGALAPRGRYRKNIASPQARNLIGWWPGRMRGQQLEDLSGFDSHGDLSGGSSSVIGDSFSVSAVDFPGNSNNRVVFPNDARWYPAGGTVCAWANADTLGQNNFGRIVYNRNGTDAAGVELLLWNTSQCAGSVDAGSASTDLQGGSVTLGETFHSGVSWGDGAVRLWQNGVQVASGTDRALSLPSTPGVLQLGIRASDNLREFDGRIWDVRFYDRPVGAAMMRQIYAPGTRWDLYREPVRRNYFVPGAAAGGSVAPRLTLMGVG